MPKHIAYLVIILCCTFNNVSAQTIHGTVTDTLGKPLPFATIKIGDTKQGLMADLNGRFRVILRNNYTFIIVSHLGFKTRKVELSNDTTHVLQVALVPSEKDLEEVVINNAPNKIKRILNHAIANRTKNNPDKYDWYQCNVYYKTTADASPDSAAAKKNMDSADVAEMNEFKSRQHFFITETFSRRTWERPQKLQEDILGSRVAGFKKAWFTSLVTDVLPFHSYNDFLKLNGKDYHSPLSSGLFQRYRFRLEDEILQGNDTIWHITFTPKKNAEELTGSLFISSNMFAITNLTAEHYDSSLHRFVGVEQQYSFQNGKWFPQQLNYIVRWEEFMGQPANLLITGRSIIDSVTFDKDEKFRFDKAHTAKLRPGADELTNSQWDSLRAEALDNKESRTYEFMDSLGSKYHFDSYVTSLSSLVEGYLPWHKIDIDLTKLYSYNAYEKHRVGFGLRTSTQFSKTFTLGGWFGYGFGDKTLKYGGFTEVYLDRYKEFKFRVNYQNDIQDPGRLQINEELDKNFLRRFTLRRVDKVVSYSFEMYKKLGYLNAVLGFNAEQITPQYNYFLNYPGKTTNQFETKEITLSLRYAYAERMSPMLGRYFSSGSKYPVLYSKIKFGDVTGEDNQYIHAVGAAKWQTHINHVGTEQFLFLAGGVFSKKPLPLSKLFAGNGFRTDGQSFYVFGGMQTMLPYQYYSDKFINFYWKHNFDFKFYNLKLSKNISSSPMLSVAYNVLWGKLKDAGLHQFVQFSVPDPAYHETGLLINRVVRMKFAGMMYLDLNAGYFYHPDGPFNHKQNGRIVFGLNAEL
jgi:hypothetical protein